MTATSLDCDAYHGSAYCWDLVGLNSLILAAIFLDHFYGVKVNDLAAVRPITQGPLVSGWMGPWVSVAVAPLQRKRKESTSRFEEPSGQALTLAETGFSRH